MTRENIDSENLLEGETNIDDEYMEEENVEILENERNPSENVEIIQNEENTSEFDTNRNFLFNDTLGNIETETPVEDEFNIDVVILTIIIIIIIIKILF